MHDAYIQPEWKHKVTYKVDSESHWVSCEFECSLCCYNITAILMDQILMEPGKHVVFDIWLI